MSIDGEGGFIIDLSGEVDLKSFCSLISVCNQYYHFGHCAVNQIAEVICIANSFGGLYLSCDTLKLGSGFCQVEAIKKMHVSVYMHVYAFIHNNINALQK